MKLRLLVCSLLALTVAVIGCRRDDASEPVYATPSLSLNHARAPLGSPLELTYRFVVEPGAPKLTGTYRVFAHVLDDNEEIMWTDDHTPPVPASSWTPGQTIQYSRTVFIPIYPYIGPAAIHLGLYAPDSSRLRLAGDDRGQRAYRVATLELLPQTENVFLIYRDGWHQPEVAGDNATVEWQWTKKESTLQFRNPKRDVVFYLHLDAEPAAFQVPQSVDVLVGGQKVDTFTLATRDEMIRKIAIPAAVLGTADTAEVRLVVDRTFVPALVPALSSSDSRELGIRVFHAFVEPQ